MTVDLRTYIYTFGKKAFSLSVFCSIVIGVVGDCASRVTTSVSV